VTRTKGAIDQDRLKRRYEATSWVVGQARRFSEERKHSGKTAGNGVQAASFAVIGFQVHGRS
jgi:hypothetical protein